MTLSIIAIIISVFSAFISVGMFLWTARRDRKKATIDAYNILQEQALDALNEYSVREIEQDAEKKSSSEYRELSKLLARLEHFSVGVNTKIYDRKVVYKLAHGYLDAEVHRKVEPLINQKQKGSEKEFYQCYSDLVRWMEKRAEKKKSSCFEKQKKEDEADVV